MRKIKALAIFNALSLFVHIAFAYMTQVKAINQKDVSEISAQYETLFTPAGITFAIWGLIYVTLAIMCLYHIVIAYKHDKFHPANTDLEQMGGLFILVSLSSAAWLYAWTHDQLSLSVSLIVLQLIGLFAIHQRLHMYDTFKTAGLKVCTQFPLSIYFGWISIATIANISSFLVAKQWDGYGIAPSQWVVIMMSVAILLSVMMILFRRNIYFGLVIAWGFYGIIVKRETVSPGSYNMIINTAWAGIGIIGILSVIQLVRNITHKKPKPVFPSMSAPVK
jgi:hypothetical protein